MGTAFVDGARRWPARLGFAFGVIALWLSLCGASAFAAGEAHPFMRSFGTFANPNGIAIDAASGDVYVADIGTDTVYKFDANGNPVNFSGLGSNALTGSATPAKAFSFPNVYGTPAALAVDNSTSPSDPSAGDLYVMDAGHKVVDKFTAAGAYLGQITGPFSGELLGLGVDARGRVRIETPGISLARIDVFDATAANNAVTSFELHGPSGSQITFSEQHGLAVSPSGDDYPLYTCGCSGRFGLNGEPFGMVDNSGDVAVAVDPVTGHLYADEQSSVKEWDTGEMNGSVDAQNSSSLVSGGKLVSSFGALQLSGVSGQGGIAVSPLTGDIYVSNPADGKVYVFGTAAPSVAFATPTNVTETSATFQGTVNPNGAPVTSCQFEYEASAPAPELPITTFANSVPCDLTPAQIGSGSNPVAVTADVGNLQAGDLYHVRLNATNSEGTSFGTGLFATAGPGFGVKTFEVSFLNTDGTPDTQAGSHPYEMIVNIAYNTRALQREANADSRYVPQPDGNFKNVIVDLPPGLVGDPNATTKKCALTQLDIGEHGESCPAESLIGELEAEFGDNQVTYERDKMYNIIPPHGVADQIGGHLILPNVFINSGVEAGGDYPVQSTVLNSPVIVPVITTRLTIYGVPPGSAVPRKPFLTLPTGCTGPLRSSMSVDSYQDPGHYVTADTVTHDSAGQPVALTGCSRLQFPPTITASPDTTDASTSSGLTVGVHISQKAAFNPEGLAESALRDTTVTLPEGVAINPAGADGLEACSEGLAGFTGFAEFNPEFEPGVKTATFTPEMPEPLLPGTNFCPDGSKIGTVKIKTPLLEHELEGAVYLASQNANPFGSLVAMYMIAQDEVSGTIIKLTGEVKLSDTGQIVTTFKNTPDLPFEELQLHFFGGERAPLTTPSRCGTYTTKAAFVPWDGNSPVEPTSSFTIEHGPNGGPCPGVSLPFNPSLAAGTTSIQAGGFSPFTMTMSREDGQQSLQAISLKMPPGLSGLLTGVELCGEAQANAGTCGPNSLIGETIVSVGVGNDPFSVKGGKVYLTGPYRGAPFGLSIVNPAKAGPYDLGQVVVRAKIEVDPVTADLTVSSDNEGPYKIPTIIDGIPLQIKHVNVTINRPGFTFNPTDCNPMSITGAIDSTESASDTVNVPFQATNCARLSFKPSFEVSTSGKTSRLEGASLHVKLVYPKLPFGSQANIASVKVDLPRQLPSNLEALKHACIDTTFNANPAACPAESRVGSAMATTPLIPVALTGPAYFVSHGGAKFPELIVVLQGYGVTVDLHGETFIKNGITSSTFHTIPDVPVGTFELNLPQRPKYAALAAPGGLCGITKTVLVKRQVKVRSKNGTTHTVTRNVKQTIAAGLAMPTAFTAQNGAVIHQNTPIEVTGCSRAKKTSKKSAHHKKGKK